jgi:hypothetical protein
MGAQIRSSGPHGARQLESNSARLSRRYGKGIKLLRHQNAGRYPNRDDMAFVP